MPSWDPSPRRISAQRLREGKPVTGSRRHARRPPKGLHRPACREQVAQGKPEIRIGIGIASGRVIAGYTGTQRRVTYTCVGDPVNLAAHLEAHTKVLGKPILIDEQTRAALSEPPAWRTTGR
jgi:class 3 adenylate cyclase